MTAGIATALATWFGCGLVPKGPGTAGSAGGLIVAAALAALGWPPWSFALLAAALAPAGIWAAGAAARQSGRKDPQTVVIDEVLGQWIALAGAPLLNVKTFLIAFVLFRIFDIWKPFPIRRLEALPGGTGIVADDLMAGLYAAAALALVGRLLA